MASNEHHYPIAEVITVEQRILNATTETSDEHNDELTLGIIYTISIAIITGAFVIAALAFMLIIWKRRQTLVHDHRVARRLMIDSVSSCQTSYQRFDVNDSTDVLFSTNISLCDSARHDVPAVLTI